MICLFKENIEDRRKANLVEGNREQNMNDSRTVRQIQGKVRMKVDNRVLQEQAVESYRLGMYKKFRRLFNNIFVILCKPRRG